MLLQKASRLRKTWQRVSRIKSRLKSIRDNINAMALDRASNSLYDENKRLLLEKIVEVVDLFYELVAPGDNGTPPDYESIPPEEINLSLRDLLVIFRQTISRLQRMPPEIQESALEILYSYFIELQGLYDLIFVSTSSHHQASMPLTLTAIENHHSRYFRLSPEIESDPAIQEYRSIKYHFLMKGSVSHHLNVIFFDLLPQYCYLKLKEFVLRTPRCRGIIDPNSVLTLDELRAALRLHPLSASEKQRVALHRHTMRIFDIIFTKIVLRAGRTVFESLVLAIWIQTVKDHIVPNVKQDEWEANHLNVEQEVSDKAGPGKIKMSSAFFMQPRVTFQLERFLIFKIRTMTVGDVVRVTELGNWMRQNSPDEFLQFFNIALGDMGGLGIRTMPEHEIVQDKETEWLYGALMSFIPGGMTSPGSIVMRKTNYGLTKAQQLFREIIFYDPRFKGSSGFFSDIGIILKSVGVLNKGRVGKALQKTESFEGKKRGW